ncbi:hypothetical protein BHF71_10945 [Vulcanibacillus modesticaldus]|uniref:Serine aminopeptidase S33 domain-containing protein n=1 Tax=Vulcanibacillus modesticaldus TaxID=337097 RepID=A0A1D2YSR0_9BACI|nr:hypothetical protein BHF71_10945 [Vulcanibacillus modesticaldus]
MVDDGKAIVVAVHGSGEHLGRYKHIAKWLNDSQISMIGGDLPGLGRAKGKRGHIDDFNDYLREVDKWIKFAKENWPDLPIFLYGHSMGGLIVLRYIETLEDKDLLNGVIVTSPAIKIGVTIPKWQLVIASLLEKIWPTFRMKSGIKPDQVSRDPNVVEQYTKDPLVYGKVSIGWFFEFVKAIEEVWKNVDKINNLNFPILYLQAGADQLVDPKAADQFVELLHKEKVTYRNIPNLYHEIFNEPEKEEYLKIMTEWILKTI